MIVQKVAAKKLLLDLVLPFLQCLCPFSNSNTPPLFLHLHLTLPRPSTCLVVALFQVLHHQWGSFLLV